MLQLLERAGFQVEYAGDYSRLDHALQARDFDAILLEVTGEHAVEAAVAAALRVKRVNARQFVGYLADPSLHSSGLAGDGIFPRSPNRLSAALRGLLATENGADSSSQARSRFRLLPPHAPAGPRVFSRISACRCTLVGRNFANGS